MNGKQLKNSILQWAIQGKLVPQDPNDEPASVLLDKIRQEKERLIKEKKIKRDKNASIIYRGEDNSYYEKMLATGEVKCIDEEIPFEVPQGWEWSRLSSIVSLLGDGIHGTPEYSEDGSVYFINGNNLSDGQILIKTDTKRVSKEEAIKHSRLLNESTVLVSINGTIGNIAFYSGESVILGKSACYFNLLNGIEKEYIKVILLTDYFLEYAKRVATGSTIKNVPLSGMRNLLVPIPANKEQKLIIDKLSSFKPLLEKFNIEQLRLERLNVELYPILRKSILQEAIQGKLVPQIAEEGTAKELLEQIRAEKQRLVKEGKLKKSALNDSVIFRGDDNRYYEQIGKNCVDITEEIPFSIPANWKWVRIRDVFQLNPKNEADNETLAAFIPMEKISAGYKSDFTFDLVKWGNIKKGFTHFANGDVAFAKITPCFQNRKSAIFHGLPNGIGAGTTELKVLRPYGNTIGRWYLLYFLESPYFIDEATFKGTANQQRIVVGYLENKLFPLPPRKQQQRIVEKIEQLMQLLK
ncbi:restriction endonuclease subunit S [Segatella copri]|uniref:restriction endonuclease subunit S n=1 Tax=Segatella copri TaxID=165179 RepID=UPI002FF007CB